MYNFKLNLYSGGSKIGSFNVANLFDNIIVDIHSDKDYSTGRYRNNIIVNQTRKVFPRDSFSKESAFYINGRSNKNIDSRFGFSNPKDLLIGSSLVSNHMVSDSNLRLGYYTQKVNEYKDLLKDRKISDGTYAMLRYHAQKATKLQLSVIGQNLSEFPPLGKPMSIQRAHAEAIASGKKKLPANAFTTRKNTTTSSKVIRGVGTGVIIVSAAQSVYSIVKSENKGEALAKEGVGWGASIAGGEIGMQAGASLGGSIGVCFGGIGYAPGAAFGGFIGGIAGGIGGYIWGMDTMNDFFNNSKMKNSKGFEGGFGGGGYSGGGTVGGW
jgi:hypothetical protein